MSVVDWWGAGGRAGWILDGDLGTAPAWTLAGLVAGAWRFEGPGRPVRVLPSPGIQGAQEPLAWCDTLGIVAVQGGAWDGYDATLATARGGQSLVHEPGDDTRPRSDVTLMRGDHESGDNAIGFSRGDTLRGLRIEAASGRRGTSGGIAAGARNLYAVAGATTRGRHRLAGMFSHRRSSASLTGGESEAARGEAGGAEYRYRDEGWQVSAALLRGYGQHDSRGGPWAEQRRLADATVGRIAFERSGSGARWGVRASWREASVAPNADDPTRLRARELWGAARWQRPFGDGELDLRLGVGQQSALSAITVAPSLEWRYGAGPWDARVAIERLATPVWADLAAGERPFLQDTWVGGIEAGTAVAGVGRARLGFLAGHTGHRAILARIPLEAVALREGFRADPAGYGFGLLGAGGVWRTEHWWMSLDGFALAREASSLQARVDPGAGARAAIEFHAHYFRGDLGVRPRIEGWVVGARESEASPSRRLPADGTVNALLALSIADAVILFEGRDLLDRQVRQTWIDRATGVEALGPGRQFRFTFNWRLWD